MPWIYHPLHPELGLRFIPASEARRAAEGTPVSGIPADLHSAEGDFKLASGDLGVAAAIPQRQVHTPNSIGVHLRSSAVVTPAPLFLGLDLGQVSDPTALAILRQLSIPDSPPPGLRAGPGVGASSVGRPPSTYELVALHRYPPRTPY